MSMFNSKDADVKHLASGSGCVQTTTPATEHAMTLIKIDEENNAEEFWDAARDHVGPFKEAIALLLDDGELSVNADERDQLLSFFRRLPGWASGMSHAKHPIIVLD